MPWEIYDHLQKTQVIYEWLSESEALVLKYVNDSVNLKAIVFKYVNDSLNTRALILKYMNNSVNPRVLVLKRFK